MNKLYVFTVLRNGQRINLSPVAGNSLTNALERAMRYNVLLSADTLIEYSDFQNPNFR
jgi:hypothetical protein